MPLIEWAMRNSVSTALSTGSSPADNAASARPISWRWSPASSTKSVLYFSRFRGCPGSVVRLRERLLRHFEHVIRLEGLHDEVACSGLERLHHERLLAERAA